MLLKAIEEWYDDIRLEVPGAPNPIIQSRIRLAAIETCKRTMVSHETLDPIDIEADVAKYKIEPPSSCLRIWRVLWLKTPYQMLTPLATRNLESAKQDWDKPEADAPTEWVQVTNEVVQLIPRPRKALDEGLIAHVAFIPDPRTPKLDDRLYFYYKEAIIAGTLSKLLRMSGTTWYDPKAANEREREFQVELTRILSNASKDDGVADLTVTMRPFA